jgi:SAM-dependent methyltransferase
MSVTPWRVYGAALESGSMLTARRADGGSEPLAVSRWLADADTIDERVLDRVRGRVLDVGCGPGRHVHALCRRGVDVVGIDASTTAVSIATKRGGNAILGDVFTHDLKLASWQTVLLLDGNLGIGGNPEALLRRVRELLSPSGRALVETNPPGRGVELHPVRLELGAHVSFWFPWARVCNDAIRSVADSAAFSCDAQWEDGGRWFAELTCR